MYDNKIQNGHGFLILYDITNTTHSQLREMFTQLFEKLCRVKDEEKIPMVLVGSKCDLENGRKIDYQSGDDLAKEFKIPFFETSSVIPVNIEESVFALVEEFYRIKVLPLEKHENKETCLLM
jgi:GTPase KRas